MDVAFFRSLSAYNGVIAKSVRAVFVSLGVILTLDSNICTLLLMHAESNAIDGADCDPSTLLVSTCTSAPRSSFPSLGLGVGFPASSNLMKLPKSMSDSEN